VRDSREKGKQLSKLQNEFFMQHVRRLVAVPVLTILLAVPTFAKTSAPVVVTSRGYINEAALMTHTTMAFNSKGTSTLVAFVSSHPSWNGQSVIISGLSDNGGNTWNVLTGPASGRAARSRCSRPSATLMLRSTSATHRVTVNLTNPAPLVVHVFAVSGSDITGPPIYSVLTNPAVGGTSADVTAKPIACHHPLVILAQGFPADLHSSALANAWRALGHRPKPGLYD
jgi:hypothetical protein